MKTLFSAVTSVLVLGILSVGLVAQTSAGRYDGVIQDRVSQELAKKAGISEDTGDY